jgi:hypothetical protein
MYQVLLVASAPRGRLIHDIDHEIDALTGLALSRQWDRVDFRRERRALGELVATYVDAVRAEIGERSLALESIWSWADDPDGEGVSEDS